MTDRPARAARRRLRARAVARARPDGVARLVGRLARPRARRTSRRPPPPRPTPADAPPGLLRRLPLRHRLDLRRRAAAGARPPSSTGCRRRCPRRASSATSSPTRPRAGQLLTGQRVFTWLWRRVLDWRLNGTRLLPALLNVRNLFQVLVSADHRYGPLYSFGIARVARERLEAHGYRPGSRTPVVLLGSSGGGQISVGAATYPRRRDRRAARHRHLRRGDGVRPRHRGGDAARLALRHRRQGLRARPHDLPRPLAAGGRLVLERRPVRSTG